MLPDPNYCIVFTSATWLSAASEGEQSLVISDHPCKIVSLHSCLMLRFALPALQCHSSCQTLELPGLAPLLL